MSFLTTRHHEGEDTFEERLPIAKQLEVCRFAPEIDGDGAVFAGPTGSVAHGHPSVIRSRKMRRHHGGNALQSQDHCEGLRVLPLKARACGIFVIYHSSLSMDEETSSAALPQKGHTGALGWQHRGSRGSTVSQRQGVSRERAVEGHDRRARLSLVSFARPRDVASHRGRTA